MPRLVAAGAAALARWEAAGGEGAGAITHLIAGGLTAPRAAPGARAPRRSAPRRAAHAKTAFIRPARI
jgi:hypothetical protein